MKHRRRLKPGDEIRVNIVGYVVMSTETILGHVVLESKVTGEIKQVVVDCDYVFIRGSAG